jgi:hypothetical protein
VAGASVQKAGHSGCRCGHEWLEALALPAVIRQLLPTHHYCSAALAATFGTTGVTITQARVQRLMLVDGVLSLAFSTLILAVAAVPLSTRIA